MNHPADLKYSSDHEWVKVEGTTARIGISDFAQDNLGDIVWVDLPAQGLHVDANGAFSEVESTKSVSEIFAPVSGTIVEVNDQLQDAPELLNRDPYGTGWICVVEMSDPTELDSLLDAAAYESLIGDE
jgi:glycine cleavage system H protein